MLLEESETVQRMLAEVRYRTIDRCTEFGCRCLDRDGIVLYDGPSLDAANDAATKLARYPNPEVEVLPF